MSDPAEPQSWENGPMAGQPPPQAPPPTPPAGAAPAPPAPPGGTSASQPAHARGGPPPGAPLPPSWARRAHPGQPASFAGVRGDPGAWAAVGVLVAVVLTIVADVLLSADRVSVGGFRVYSRGTLRAHFLVATGFASVEVALALLLAVGLAAAIRPSVPASFRRTAVAAAGGLAALVAVLAVLRALIIITYGHAFGVSGFVGSLAAVPVAVAALAIALGVSGRPSA